MAVFSYTNRDPKNIRNVREWGGGGLMDIGCYPIQIARYLFGREPVAVSGAIQRDPDMGIDRLTSALLDFGTGPRDLHVQHAAGGLPARARARAPRAASRSRFRSTLRPMRRRGSSSTMAPSSAGGSATVETFEVCDQYTLQGDEFARAILGTGDVPTPLEDSLATMTVLEQVVHAAEPAR